MMMLGSRSGRVFRYNSFARRFLSTIPPRRDIPNDGLSLGDFVSSKRSNSLENSISASDETSTTTFHIKTYGCQMNVSDSDIVRALLLEHGWNETLDESGASVLLTNTCAIREGAEQKVWGRLQLLQSKQAKRQKKEQQQIIGVLGCMAERLKQDLLKDGMADLVVGPDAYRDLPRLLDSLLEKEVETAVNVQLSLEETYADVTPVRHNSQDISAFISVMRGCNNMCSYCVVPFTRGRERSRPYDSVVREAQQLIEEEGVKEIVLLGQNVNSYHDKSEDAIQKQPVSSYSISNDGFSNLYRLRGGAGYYFADLVAAVSDISPEVRVRFTSPHPKDYPPELLQIMAERANVSSQLHMPAQSGNSNVLERMRRGYSREAYLQLIDDVRAMIPDVAISSDFIAGFCGETEEEHLDTLSLMEQVQYDQAYMYAYSMRGKTHAHRKMIDDISKETKKRRLQEVIHTFRATVQKRNDDMEVGRLRLVLMEGDSRKSTEESPSWQARTDQNKRVVFPLHECFKDSKFIPKLLAAPNSLDFASSDLVSPRQGDYGVVQINEARGHTLRGTLLWRTTLQEFTELNMSLVDEAKIVSALSKN